jgi:hypothetical protein
VEEKLSATQDSLAATRKKIHLYDAMLGGCVSEELATTH